MEGSSSCVNSLHDKIRVLSIDMKNSKLMCQPMIEILRYLIDQKRKKITPYTPFYLRSSFLRIILYFDIQLLT